MKSSFFNFNLLEAELICFGIEVIKAGSMPLLVFLGVIFFQADDVLGHFLKDLSLEGTLRLARGQLGLDAIVVCLRGVETTAKAIEFPLLG